MTGDEHTTNGVTFGALADDLERETYPLARATVVERYGDRELHLDERSVTVRELLAPLDDTTYATAGAVRRALVSMVGADAVGRTDYSDRAGASQGVDREQRSF
jgi:hypothetical protein